MESESAIDPVRSYFKTVWKILTDPSSFFRNLKPSGSISRPVAFALVTHWIGSALAFLWIALIGWVGSASVGGFLDRAFKVAGEVVGPDDTAHFMKSSLLARLKEGMTSGFFSLGAILLDPFLTLASILFTSALVYIGARILVPDQPSREVSYSSAVRIVAFGMTPAILTGIPIFGGLLGYFLIALVTIIGAREVYHLGWGRATCVALFPKLLLLGLVLGGLAALSVLVIRLLSSMF